MKRTRLLILILFGVGLALLSPFCEDPDPKPPIPPPATDTSYAVMPEKGFGDYPRSVFSSFGTPPPWFVAQFDMARTATDYDEVHLLNPDALCFVSRDWNVWEIKDRCPPEWYAQDPDGNPVRSGYGKLMDITEFCPKVDGRKYNTYIALWSAAKVLSDSAYDGFASQGLWEHPPYGKPIDLDRNGVNDYSEYGSDWVRKEWTDGATVAIKTAYDILHPHGKILRINSGYFHRMAWEWHNGVNLEHVGPDIYWSYDFGESANRWAKVAPEPHTTVVGAEDESKDDFRTMRYFLGYCCMFDGYAGFTDTQSNEHYYKFFYDEYKLNLGQPVGEMYRIGDSLRARKFEYGMVVINPSGQTDTLRASMLDGTYYRFIGNQDPERNNGRMITDTDYIVLESAFTQNGRTTGDAAFICDKPYVSIADIVLDDEYCNTSPGQPTPEFHGEWANWADKGKAYYLISIPNKGFYEYRLHSSDYSYAEYKARLVPGKYRLWGWIGSGDTFTQFVLDGDPYMFYHDSAIGEWRNLADIEVKAENSCIQTTVLISVKGIADAFRFEYLGK